MGTLTVPASLLEALTLPLTESDLYTSPALSKDPVDYLVDFHGLRLSFPRKINRGEVRSFDGSNNNRFRANWGAAHTVQIRLFPDNYRDGVEIPQGFLGELPSARLVSTVLLTQHPETPLAFESVLLMAWGQLIDHDLTLSLETHEAEAFWPIPVPKGDAYFDPQATGQVLIPFARLAAAEGTGQDDTVRAAQNEITAFLDASMVYGSNQEVARSLRTFDGSGTLRTSPALTDEEILPLSEDLAHAAGDSRAHENPILASLHSLLVQEHNRIASRLHGLYLDGDCRTRRLVRNIYWGSEQVETSGDAVYELARKAVSAQVQAITYHEFLPFLIGDAVAPYTGYKTYVNPAVSQEFAGAAYRLGHSMVREEILVSSSSKNQLSFELEEHFFNPELLTTYGPAAILNGAIQTPMNEVDLEITPTLQHLLFARPLDLGALNIQRGRDLGLPTFAQTAAYLGHEIETFDDITGTAVTQARLAAAYASPADVDLWAGILAEDSLTGSKLGPVGTAIIADQFTRTRDGDRFYYERDSVVTTLDSLLDLGLSEPSLANLLEANFDQEYNDVFVAQPEVEF